jgi:hypothetical protein
MLEGEHMKILQPWTKRRIERGRSQEVRRDEMRRDETSTDDKRNEV